MLICQVKEKITYSEFKQIASASNFKIEAYSIMDEKDIRPLWSLLDDEEITEALGFLLIIPTLIVLSIYGLYKLYLYLKTLYLKRRSPKKTLSLAPYSLLNRRVRRYNREGRIYKNYIHNIFIPMHLKVKKNNLKVQGNKSFNTMVEKKGVKAFNSYLAGIIESSATIETSNNIPTIYLVFPHTDKELAYKLYEFMLKGVVHNRIQKQGSVVWEIHKEEEVKKIFLRINGFMRTPKIEDLYKGIGLLFLDVKREPLDTSPLNSNSWFSGVFDRDGTITRTLINKKKNNLKQEQIIFSLNLTETRSKDISIKDPEKRCYFFVFSEIARFFNESLSTKYKDRKEKIKTYYKIVLRSVESQSKALKYFEYFTLFSSKKSQLENYKSRHNR